MSSNANNNQDSNSQPKPLPITGVVLAGGRSRRFGQDKARYVYKDKRMLDWSLESLSIAKECFIVANQAYEANVPIYPDSRTNCSETGCGPMGGLYTALKHAQNDWVALVACDMPNLTPSYWQYLFEQINNNPVKYAVVIKDNDNRLQTLAALYNKSLLPIIKTHLDSNTIALQSLSQYFNTIRIDSLPQTKKLGDNLFLNFNYLEDVSLFHD